MFGIPCSRTFTEPSILLRETTTEDYDILVADLLKTSPHRDAPLVLEQRKTRAKKLKGLLADISQNSTTHEQRTNQPPPKRQKCPSTRSVIKSENRYHFDARTSTFTLRDRLKQGFYDEKSDHTDDIKDESVYFHLPPLNGAVLSPLGDETRLFSVNKPWLETCNKRQQKLCSEYLWNSCIKLLKFAMSIF